MKPVGPGPIQSGRQQKLTSRIMGPPKVKSPRNASPHAQSAIQSGRHLGKARPAMGGSKDAGSKGGQVPKMGALQGMGHASTPLAKAFSSPSSGIPLRNRGAGGSGGKR